MARVRGMKVRRFHPQRDADSSVLPWLLLCIALLAGCISKVPNAPLDEQGNPIGVADVVDQATAAQSHVSMINAERAVMVFVAESGGNTDLILTDEPSQISAQSLARYEPGVTFNDAATVVQGEVSVRAIPPSGVILVTQDPSGTIYCSTFDYGEPVDRGDTDAQEIAECTGGWPGD